MHDTVQQMKAVQGTLKLAGNCKGCSSSVWPISCESWSFQHIGALFCRRQGNSVIRGINSITFHSIQTFNTSVASLLISSVLILLPPTWQSNTSKQWEHACRFYNTDIPTSQRTEEDTKWNSVSTPCTEKWRKLPFELYASTHTVVPLHRTDILSADLRNVPLLPVCHQ